MDGNAWRVLGAAASAAVIGGALMVAAPWRPPAPAPAAVTLFTAAPPHEQAAPAPPAPVAFSTRFRGSGPIARAQALAQNGRQSQAALRITEELARQRSFEGLCFDRFTLGAAEVVLKSCSDVAAGDRAAIQTRWLARLNAMRSIEYANPANAARET